MYRALRRRILTPAMSETSVAVRGFHEKSPESTEMLETVGRMFLTGYGYAAESRHPLEVEERLEELPVRFKGFAYEGAAMGFAVRDGLPFGSRRSVAEFLTGRADKHIYMAYVGVGWALARVPRFRWPAVTASLSDHLLRWLVLDGYGFHQAYFHPDKYVHAHYREPSFPWPADYPQTYIGRAIDQGIGRALWFVGGTDPNVVADTIESFPAERHSDLYSGAGLAATYAGGGDERELAVFRDRAGEHLPVVAQACAFAATARVRAGLVVPHNEIASRVFCGMGVAEASDVSVRHQPSGPVEGDVPAYEVWRRRVADEFRARGRA
ncbi:DUF1702 family protein [Saccharothrix australiensis]|uniref:Uncharacterized protein DUF1702 n=1 Tax=Saccharothrix australiensis TaxID=2072 RepID=A0A495W0I8_9PSEU|nr:DUF1702 family protein [Saccharothrix australiensis]RKT55211.1 uncharacterized protein DUF1702 [Saccharothrix australiensis]